MTRANCANPPSAGEPGTWPPVTPSRNRASSGVKLTLDVSYHERNAIIITPQGERKREGKGAGVAGLLRSPHINHNHETTPCPE